VRLFDDAFPEMTQTLPKGKLGAVTSTESDLPIQLDGSAKLDKDAAGDLLSYINGFREDKDLQPLTWNPQIAEAAERHSVRMLEDHFVGYQALAGGLAFEDRMKVALGNSVADYDEFHEQVAWAFAAPNAYAGLLDSKSATKKVLDPDVTEIGIGVADGDWFNGQMFTIGLVARETPEKTPDLAPEDLERFS
jgi:uncharacterized protein YkwD